MVKRRNGAARLAGQDFPLDESGRQDSAVARAVKALVRLSMDAPDGAYLGSEPQLLEQLEVSRPTLRQAAKIVQNDQLVEIRRGLNGGFYARRPEARHIVQGPAFYLRLNGATLAQAGAAMCVIMSNASAAAALNPDPALRTALRALADDLEALPDSAYTPSYIMGFERRLMKLIASMGRNPFFELFIAMMHEFGVLERDLRFYQHASDRKPVWRRLQLEHCQAVLEGDSEHAALLVHRRSALVDKWIREDSAVDGKNQVPAAVF
jgi:DNA-binding FadR family transcriptional regulator